MNLSEAMTVGSGGNGLPPPRDTLSPYGDGTVIKSGCPYVPCFSNPINIPVPHDKFLSNPSYPFLPNSNGDYVFPMAHSVPFLQDTSQLKSQFQFPPGNKAPPQDQVIVNDELQLEREIATGSQDTAPSSDMNTEISSAMPSDEMGKRKFEDQEAPSTSVGAIDMDCFWNYCTGIHY